MSLAGELRRLAERLDTPDARPARRLRVPLHQYQLFKRAQLLTPIHTVLDVGANVGRFSECAAKCFPDAEIHAFEPLPQCLEKVTERAKLHQRIHAHGFALGETAGETEMFENDCPASSSLLPMTDLHRKIWPKTAHDTRTRIQVRTLDDFAKEAGFKDPAFLKIDVQGFEMRVLRGGTEALKRVAVIMTEVLFDALYEDQTDFLELQNFLADHGFRFLEFADQNRVKEDQRLIYADAVFVRRELRFP